MEKAEISFLNTNFTNVYTPQVKLFWMCLCLSMYVYICVWTSCVLCVLSTHRYICWTSTICSLQTWTPLLANVCLTCKANTWRAFAEEDSQVTKQSCPTHACDQLWKIRHPYFCPHGANKCPTYSNLLLCYPYLGFFLAMLLFKMVPSPLLLTVV